MRWTPASATTEPRSAATGGVGAGGIRAAAYRPARTGVRARYPDLQLSFNFTDSVVDTVRHGYDMGIRIGEVTDPNYVAVRLFPNRRVVCGSPEYFARHGTPTTLEELTEHNCLAFNLQGGQQRGWTFLRDGRQVAIRVAGNLDCNDGELLFDWVKQGLGIGWRSTRRSGRAQARRAGHGTRRVRIAGLRHRAVYPQQRYLPAKVRFFIDYLKDIYNAPGCWEVR